MKARGPSLRRLQATLRRPGGAQGVPGCPWCRLLRRAAAQDGGKRAPPPFHRQGRRCTRRRPRDDMLGDTAVYLLAASNEAGRQTNAAYLLQWKAIEAAIARGCRWYDLGGVHPENNPAYTSSSRERAGPSAVPPAPTSSGPAARGRPRSASPTPLQGNGLPAAIRRLKSVRLTPGSSLEREDGLEKAGGGALRPCRQGARSGERGALRGDRQEPSWAREVRASGLQLANTGRANGSAALVDRLAVRVRESEAGSGPERVDQAGPLSISPRPHRRLTGRTPGVQPEAIDELFH